MTNMGNIFVFRNNIVSVRKKVVGAGFKPAPTYERNRHNTVYSVEDAVPSELICTLTMGPTFSLKVWTPSELGPPARSTQLGRMLSRAVTRI